MALVDHRLAADANGPAGPSSSYASATARLVLDELLPGQRSTMSGFGKAQVRTVPTPTVAVSR
jgi:hypothetical protein